MANTINNIPNAVRINPPPESRQTRPLPTDRWVSALPITTTPAVIKPIPEQEDMGAQGFSRNQEDARLQDERMRMGEDYAQVAKNSFFIISFYLPLLRLYDPYLLPTRNFLSA